MKDTSLAGAARRLSRRLDELGRVTDEPGRLTRTFLSPAMGRANRLVAGWMLEAGFEVREDAVGNLIGRIGAASCAEATRRPEVGGHRLRPRTLLLGSHLDTVRNAGRFDGALGVLLPIAALGELRRRGVKLPFAVEVLGFSEEEGVRFSCGYLGSKGFTGRLGAAELRLRDAQGVTVRRALESWDPAAGGRARRGGFKVPARAHRPSELIGYVETHIEQGPVLEEERLALGVVSAIAGQTRGRLTFRGRAGHAGTTPMALRRDALAGAAELILFAESLARRNPGLLATVGMLTVAPGAPNVIPGEAVISLDVRHARDAARRAALRRLLARARATARRRRLACAWRMTQDDGAVECSPGLTALLRQSVRATQRRGVALVSGAGHDAVVVSAVAPVAMLFVRCRAGLSHHPDEFAAPADVEAALRALVDFLGRLAAVEEAKRRRRPPPRLRKEGRSAP